MAVVQISRIQIRRGRALEGTGFPQLASGELGWAIDTQELFIGNGSVAEGSPAVGNTKILTERDIFVENNMLALIRHIYKSNDPSISTGESPNLPITRTLQQRLDDRVTVTNFGAQGNFDPLQPLDLSGADDTKALQRAIDQLFLNQSSTEAYNNTADAVKSRIILEIPAGRFKITSPLYIPSYTTLVGAGPDKTIIEYTSRIVTANVTLNNKTIPTLLATNDLVGRSISGSGIPAGSTIVSVIPAVSITINNNPTATNTNVTLTISSTLPAIMFVNNSSTPGNPNPSPTLGINQPSNILLKGMTIKSDIDNITCVYLNSVKDSIFEDIGIVGNPVSNVISTSAKSIVMSAVSDIVTCERNLFNNIYISGFTYGVFSNTDIINNTFTNVSVISARQGFSLGEDTVIGANAQRFGPRNTTVSNSYFTDIKRHAIYLEQGFGNVFEEIRLDNVGNDGGSYAKIKYPQIYIGAFGNVTKAVVSDRYKNIGSPLYQVKTTRLTLNRSISAPKGSAVVQMSDDNVIATGYLSAKAADTTTIILIVDDNDQIFNTTNELVINGDATPSDSNMMVYPTDVTAIAQSNPFIPYIPEVAGFITYESQGARYIEMGPQNTSTAIDLFKLPMPCNEFGVSTGSISYTIDYTYSSENEFIRRGKMYVGANVENLIVSLTDEYDHIGSDPTTEDSIKLLFHARIVDNDKQIVSGGSDGPFSIIVSYDNSLVVSGNRDAGTFTYSYIVTS